MGIKIYYNILVPAYNHDAKYNEGDFPNPKNELNSFFQWASCETRIPIDHLLKKEGVMLRCHLLESKFTNVLSWELLSMSNDQEALVYIYISPGSGISSNVSRQSF